MSAFAHQHSPAAERNREPIQRVLKHWLTGPARVLEIGSGTGQHAAWSHSRQPDLLWQSSEIPGRVEPLRHDLAEQAPELPEPLTLDVLDKASWPAGPFDCVFTANTLHIMPWGHTAKLLRRAAERVAGGGLLIIYGPFQQGGRFDTDSNRRFDAELRRRSSDMGLRDHTELVRAANTCGWHHEADIAMPANNRLLIFRKNR